MKKITALILALLIVLAMPITAFASETTTLTTNVPAATYTLNIPADQVIAFGATSTNIGGVTVSNAEGFADGKNLKVTVSYDAFKGEGVATTIPYYLSAYCVADSYGSNNVKLPSGNYFTFHGLLSGGLSEKSSIDGRDMVRPDLTVVISSRDWGKALGGDYSTTITFSAEVVV